MKEINELKIIDSVNERLMKPNDIKVFPLTPTHRKELRELKTKNIGHLQTQLRYVKREKMNDFIEINKKEFEKIFDDNFKPLEKLNKQFRKIVERLYNDLSEYQDKINVLEKKNPIFMGSVSLEYDYTMISDLELQDIKDTNRTYSMDKDKFIKNYGEKKFKELYSENFAKIQKEIDKVSTQYEEAINFGDLEIVKELYYYMKTCDKMFEKILNINLR